MLGFELGCVERCATPNNGTLFLFSAMGTMDAEPALLNVAATAKGPLPAGLYAEAERRLAAAGV